jgi:hypothetical protein
MSRQPPRTRPNKDSAAAGRAIHRAAGFRDRGSKIGGGHGRGFSLSAHGRQEAQSSVSARNTWRPRCIARGELYGGLGSE